jgi:hypothetical protein
MEWRKFANFGSLPIFIFWSGFILTALLVPRSFFQLFLHHIFLTYEVEEEKEEHCTADMGNQVSSFCSVISIGLWASNVTVLLNSWQKQDSFESNGKDGGEYTATGKAKEKVKKQRRE